MNEHPILFSGEMVRAILEKRKTQTRRIIKLPSWGNSWDDFEIDSDYGLPMVICRNTGCLAEIHNPYGFPGDRLWVRETWGLYDTEPKDGKDNAIVFYKATDNERHELRYQLWRPSIFMPRWASRITLEVTGVRVERLQDISPGDAWAEGIIPPYYKTPGTIGGDWSVLTCYEELWDRLNAKRGHPWKANDWVRVIEFKKMD